MAMEYIKGPTLRALIERHRVLGDAGAARDRRVRRQPRVPSARLRPQLRRARRAIASTSSTATSRRTTSCCTWDGHVKLADFGIAKANTIDRPDAEVAPDAHGKEALHEPRAAARAARWSGRSDVFAVGVVLYELLALEPLFYEDATELLIDEVTWRPLPERARARPRSSPRTIEDILTSSLDRDPAKRPTAAAMGRALDKWCESQAVVATPDRLQEHLASDLHRDLPAARPRARSSTHFSNFKRGRPPRRRQPRHLVVRGCSSGRDCRFGIYSSP